MRIPVLCATLMLASMAVQAGTTNSAIERLLVFDGGMLVYVYPVGGMPSTPSCNTGGYYSFSMTRPMAKEYLAMLMAAQARGVHVTIWGKGSCDDQSISETLDYFRVES